MDFRIEWHDYRLGWIWPAEIAQNGFIAFDAVLPPCSTGESFPLDGGPE